MEKPAISFGFFTEYQEAVELYFSQNPTESKLIQAISDNYGVKKELIVPGPAEYFLPGGLFFGSGVEFISEELGFSITSLDAQILREVGPIVLPVPAVHEALGNLNSSKIFDQSQVTKQLQVRQGLDDQLRTEISQKTGFHPKYLAFNYGVDGVLSSLFRMIREENGPSKILLDMPNYFEAISYAKKSGHTLIEVSREVASGFALPLEEYLSKLATKPRVVLLTDPTNPLGSAWSSEELRAILESVVEGTSVVIDRADAVLPVSISDQELLERYQSLDILIMRSFSKEYAMAGWRVGYAVGTREETITRLQKYSPKVLMQESYKEALRRMGDGTKGNIIQSYAQAHAYVEGNRPELENSGLKIHPSISGCFILEFKENSEERIKKLFERLGEKYGCTTYPYLPLVGGQGPHDLRGLPSNCVRGIIGSMRELLETYQELFVNSS